MDNKLKKLINKAEVISFDIFDTLLYRNVFMPADVFLLMEVKILKKYPKVPNFRDLRVIAEKTAREKIKKIHPEFEDITIHEIYDFMVENNFLSLEEATFIKDLEIEYEKKILQPRKYVKEIFEEVKKQGKKVILTSDMYLTKDILKDILNEKGYSGFEKLYVSSQERLLKAGNGNLFKKVIKDFNIKPSKILHIGDNYHCDIKIASKLKLRVFYVPRTIELFLKLDFVKSKLKTLNFFHFNERMVLAFLANKMFDNPFEKKNFESLWEGSSFNMGYYTFGITILAFSKWLLEMSNLLKIKNLLLVLNDGYMVEKALNKISPYCNPNNTNYKFVYGNRSLMLYYSLIYNPLNLFSLTFGNISVYSIRDFFETFIDDIEDRNLIIKEFEKSNINLNISINKVLSTNFSLFSAIVKTSSFLTDKANIAKEYLLSLSAEEDSALVDIGYRATLLKFIKEISAKETPSFLFSAHGTPTKVDRKNIYNFIHGHGPSFNLLLELAFSYPHGSLKYISKDTNNNYNFYLHEKDNLSENIVSLHNGIENFYDDFISELSFFIKDLYISNNFVYNWLSYLLNVPKNDKIDFEYYNLAKKFSVKNLKNHEKIEELITVTLSNLKKKVPYIVRFLNKVKELNKNNKDTFFYSINLSFANFLAKKLHSETMKNKKIKGLKKIKFKFYHFVIKLFY